MLASTKVHIFNHPPIVRTSWQVWVLAARKKLAEPRATDHGLVAQKATDTSGIIVFDIPASTIYRARDRISNEPDNVTVELVNS